MLIAHYLLEGSILRGWGGGGVGAGILLTGKLNIQTYKFPAKKETGYNSIPKNCSKTTTTHHEYHY